MRRILFLGEGVGQQAVNAWLEQHPTDEFLFAQGSVTGSYVSIWARDMRNVPCITLPSEAYGLALVREALDAASFLYPLPQVMVWGNALCFVDGRRCAGQDVLQAVVVEEARRYGLSGWGWVDGDAVPF